VTKYSPEERVSILEKAKAMRPMSWWKIGQKLGVSHTFLQYNLEPGYDVQERKRKINARRRERAREQGIVGSSFVHLTETTKQARLDARKLLKEIPEDTRSITGFIFGDPLPGRSALDREQRRGT
jgi:hypothetical protein